MIIALGKLDSLGIDIRGKNKKSVEEAILITKSHNDTISVEFLNKLVSIYNKSEKKIEENRTKIESNEILINEKTKEYQILLDDFNKKYNYFISISYD